MKNSANSKATNLIIAATLVIIATSPAYAAGLSQATTVLNTLKENLTTIIPVAATVALMLCGLLYAMRMMHKDTFVHWFIGILIVGSAAEITSMIVS
ncbi:TrbC/VirB2 family protein [Candidatus Burkholderia verschuerenii]|uniref:TrbC/VirB2 family protein n=1 Tax=Candidatus Burkholderia verschuerenii TaxID=242163 RepID=UPI00067D6B39|nr:TrbC/VirB2 family protein [Candidatus Burkholderia verschuerenii]